MKNIEKKYKEIIPPNNYENRRDFDNKDLIKALSEMEKKSLEDMLIEDLKISDDILIIETLVFLNSIRAIDLIKGKLVNNNNLNERIIISTSLYALSHDKELIEEAYNSFLKIKDKYSKIAMFYYLAKFNNIKVNQLLTEYSKNEDTLLSYNANEALKLIANNK